MSKRKNSAFYVEEREKYAALFAKVKTHHLHPHERQGGDSEFNLFPWTERSHVAWHQLFGNLTTREAWPLLGALRSAIWEATRGIEQVPCPLARDVARWREEWLSTFGSSTLEQAQYVVRCMMLVMAFGHRAFTKDMESSDALRALVAAIPPGGDRAWAFTTGFKKDLATDSYGALKRQIACVLKNAKLVLPLRKPTKPMARP